MRLVPAKFAENHSRPLSVISTSMAPKPSPKAIALKPEQKRHLNNVKREAKTAKTLAVVVGCFTVCWLPFSVLYVLGLGVQVNSMAMRMATWLGYLNSVVNPFIYAFYNRHFLDSFKRLTIGVCRTTVHQTSRFQL